MSGNYPPQGHLPAINISGQSRFSLLPALSLVNYRIGLYYEDYFLYLQYSYSPLFITFRKRCTPSACPPLLIFRIDRTTSLLYRVPRSGSFTVQRDGNRMDSYQMSTVDVPESPIASEARSPWQQQRCDSLHCHEERCMSRPMGSWGGKKSYV